MNFAKNSKLSFFSNLRELLDMIKFEQLFGPKLYQETKWHLFPTLTLSFEKCERC
jgi:hypothetical protein